MKTIIILAPLLFTSIFSFCQDSFRTILKTEHKVPEIKNEVINYITKFEERKISIFDEQEKVVLDVIIDSTKTKNHFYSHKELKWYYCHTKNTSSLIEGENLYYIIIKDKYGRRILVYTKLDEVTYSRTDYSFSISR